MTSPSEQLMAFLDSLPDTVRDSIYRQIVMYSSDDLPRPSREIRDRAGCIIDCMDEWKAFKRLYSWLLAAAPKPISFHCGLPDSRRNRNSTSSMLGNNLGWWMDAKTVALAAGTDRGSAAVLAAAFV